MDARGQAEVVDLVAEVKEIIEYLRDAYGDEAQRAFISRLVDAFSAEIEEAQAS